MKFDRKLWLKSFDKDNIPEWTCPKCHRGFLELEQDKFYFYETKESLETREQSDFYPPEYIEYRFIGTLKCNNKKCAEKVLFCGIGGVEEVIQQYDEISGKPLLHELDIGVFDYFSPTYFNPPLEIFPIPPNCPKNIILEVKKAFSLYWCEISSSGNKIRIIVEFILDYLKIKKRVKKEGRFKKISLHDRILLFHPTNPDIGELLLAMKWIGNIGSHTNNLTREDLLTDFELLQFVINEIFINDRKRLKKIAQKIIKSKGRSI